MLYNLNMTRGFTIIEILVSLGIMALLTSLLLLYSRTGEKQIMLFKEQAGLVSAVLRAKSLSIQTFSEQAPACGYGIRFNLADNNFVLYKDSAPNCEEANRSYDPGEELETHDLPADLQFTQLDLTDVVFVPPDPKTFLDQDPSKKEALVRIGTADGTAEITVKINNAGQVTTQK